MVNQLALQVASEALQTPDTELLQRWADAVLEHQQIDNAELSVRIVDETESAHLNQQYRHKTGATNVLSFYTDTPDGYPMRLLGDLAICAPVVNREADEQDKSPDAHWAHMLTHGILHLLGYDHQQAEAADKMEQLEVEILKNLGFENPYI